MGRLCRGQSPACSIASSDSRRSTTLSRLRADERHVFSAGRRRVPNSPPRAAMPAAALDGNSFGLLARSRPRMRKAVRVFNLVRIGAEIRNQPGSVSMELRKGLLQTCVPGQGIHVELDPESRTLRNSQCPISLQPPAAFYKLIDKWGSG
jgi:hypothetical protein